MAGSGTADDPWVLKTPPGTSEYRMWRDEEANPRRSSVRSGPPVSAISCGASRTSTRC